MMNGYSVKVNGVVEETSINYSRIFYLISSLYALVQLVDKLFEYLIYYVLASTMK